ncbi:unnamed protein product, partial [Prorocentrum cordatum]
HQALERLERQLLGARPPQQGGPAGKDPRQCREGRAEVVSRLPGEPPREAPPPVGAPGPEHGQPRGAPAGRGVLDLCRSEQARGACGGADCLPREAVVWVEGQDAPRQLQQLQEGQKVLCYDSLGDCVDYV